MSNGIKFVHCRNLNDDGSINPRGGLCIAYATNDDQKVVGYAAAECPTNYNYVKAVARAKAAGRMKSAKYYQDAPELDEKVFIINAREGYQDKFQE